MSEPADDSMEGTSSDSRKRKSENDLVDPDDGTVISKAKKARNEPDIDKKVKCLIFLVSCYISIFNEMFGNHRSIENVTISCYITNIIFTGFTMKRQKANGITGNTERKATNRKEFKVTSLGQDFSIQLDRVLEIIDTAAKGLNLEFKKFGPKDKDNWYGTVLPYLDFHAAFKLRMNELRLGHSTMPIMKSESKSTSFPVEKYGLTGAHHVLLEGSSYPPEKRAAMAQSLGPMTAFLLHMRTDERYRQKWTDATKRALSHIPFIDEILSVTKGKKAEEVRSLVGALADLVLISTSRQAQRMFIPLNVMAMISTVRVGTKGTYYGERKISNATADFDTILKFFNVSGNGGMFVYQLSSMLNLQLEGDMSESQAKQVYFHSVFGTYKEDLSILSQITNQGTWNTREELGKCFVKKEGSTNYVNFNPPKMKYYSKLTSANQTKLFSSTYSQICTVPVFSGVRIQNFRDEFFDNIGQRSGAAISAKTVPQLTATITEIIGELRQQIINDGKIMQLGTVQWKNAVFCDPEKGGEVLPDLVLNGTGKFFLGKND